MWVCRDSRVSGARGAAPCCGKAAISERGKVPCAEITPSAERTRPQGCISAPFVPKGLFAFPALGAFFQISPRFLARQGKPEKGGGFLIGHGLGFRHNALKDCASTTSRWLRVRRSSWDNFCRNTFSRFSSCRIFLLPVLNLGSIPRVFFSRFRHGWSLLSTCRHRKRTVDFLGCPFD